MVYNILAYNVHTPFFYNLSSIGHEWYSSLPWDKDKRPKPDNFHSVRECEINNLIKRGFFDFQILSTPEQFKERRTNLPTLYIEHNTQSVIRPHDVTDSKVVVMWGERVFDSWIKRPNFSYFVFPEFMRYKPRSYVGDKKHILTVCKEFKQRDWCCGYSFMWEEITHSLPRKIVGSGNEEIPDSVGCVDFKALKEMYAQSRVYFNSTICWNTTASQEAILTGMPFVCTDIKAPFQNEEEIIKSRDITYLRGKLIELLEDINMCKKIGAKAKKRFLSRMSLQAFTDTWELGFEEAIRRFK